MKFQAVLILFFLTMVGASAQDTTITREEKSSPVILNKITGSKTHGLSYENELSMGAKVTTTGWGIFSDYTRAIDPDKKRVYYFELAFLKDPKETKRVNEFTVGFTNPKPFVYGKQNAFFNLKAATGQKLMIGEKAEKSGFQVAFDYVAGVSAGFVKPYYLEVYNTEDGGDLTKSIKYTDETASLFLDATSIYGASGFSVGFNEISFVPGLFGKAGMNFDWATYDDWVKALEAGIGGELYLKEIPIMISDNNRPYFLYLYLSLQFGKKW